MPTTARPKYEKVTWQQGSSVENRKQSGLESTANMRRARGLIDLVFDLVEETTNLVEGAHKEAIERWARRLAPIEPVRSTARLVTGIQTAITGGTCTSIRLINRITRSSVNAFADVVEAGVRQVSDTNDLELAEPVSSAAAGTASWRLDHLQSSLNGFWGDYLGRTNRHLDLGMSVRHHGRPLPVKPQAFAAAFPNPTNKICLFVHGLAATEHLWSLASNEHYGDPDVTFGTRLSDDLGYTPIFLRYNTGRHVSDNGCELARLLTDVLQVYPAPVEEITLIGHSMGGLVVRSAAHYARQHDEPWLEKLRHVACLGSPHLGAPLEKAVSLISGVLKNVETAGTQVPAELLDGRSAGIKDLRYGYTVEEEWAGKDPDAVFSDARRTVPPVDGVGYYFLAATIATHPEHLLGRLLGDLMVRLPSAKGDAPDPARRVRFSEGAVFPGMNHVQIANHPDVYKVLREFLG